MLFNERQSIGVFGQWPDFLLYVTVHIRPVALLIRISSFPNFINTSVGFLGSGPP
jgi:hypothetical protein